MSNQKSNSPKNLTNNLTSKLANKELIIAADLGASSGRLMAGYLEQGKLHVEEVHRFSNNMVKTSSSPPTVISSPNVSLDSSSPNSNLTPPDIKKSNGNLIWDLDALLQHIIDGLKKITKSTSSVKSIGFDTWGVDYVLLDADGELVDISYTYRDHRTDAIYNQTINDWGKEFIYNKTGVQFFPFNTLFQLVAHKQQNPQALKNAHTLLLLPDYFHYKFSGVLSNEYTEASTTQFMHYQTKAYDLDLLNKIGIVPALFPPMVMSGTVLGPLLPEMQAKTGLPASVQIIAPCTHDTASGVAAFIGGVGEVNNALSECAAFIISGTWSIIGIETPQAIISAKTLEVNFSNEGGPFGNNLFLKNIMGMWIFNSVRAELTMGMAKDQPIASIIADALKESSFRTLINPNALCFFNPSSMVATIQDYAKNTQQPVPQTLAQFTRCIYDSLALLYNKILEELEILSGRHITTLNIIGGGCKNEHLNQLCANITKRKVIVGPVEASVIGNIAVQLIALGKIKDLTHARQIIKDSEKIQIYTPQPLAINLDTPITLFETLYLSERN